MDITASVPNVIEKTAKNKKLRVYIALIPPIVTHDDFLDELKRNGFNISDACRYDKALCYAKVFGGVVISNDKSFIHVHLEGFVYEGNKGEQFSPCSFTENPYACYAFDDGSVLCFTKEKRGKFIDNIGLRLIVR
ncbi:MAG: hypothetical protein RXR08_03380 [Sulfolobaceae archaeon]|jgi:hypothetical protein|uniref:hypothetical protein n=1 Tax=Stygiolobus sp. CP850M TaxID=3133134 RepID=UPI00307DBB10